jgi:hypothetical protein
MELDIPNRRLREFYDYWNAQRGTRTMPDRRAIDPIEMWRWLGNLVLLDVIDGGVDFRYRIHGSVLAGRVGMDLTGRLLSEATHSHRDTVLHQYAEVCRSRKPLLILETRYQGPPYTVVDRLVLPLSENDEQVTMIVAAIYPSA